MRKDILKDYFSFSKKERIAVLVLIGLIIVIFILPYLVPESRPKTDTKALKRFQEQLAELDSLHSDSVNAPSDNRQYHPYEETTSKRGKEAVKSLFYFDPNRLPAEGWKQLGMPDRTIRTIKNYLSKGGKFHNPEDLGKIYGIHEDELKRLMPYVQLGKETVVATSHFEERSNLSGSAKTYFPGKKSSSSIIEINKADTLDFIALPGIGSKLAARIVSFRQKLGGFYKVEQVGETYALPDSTFKKIQSRLVLSEVNVNKININAADVNQLKQHPYIRWSLANAIVNFRLQHGNFKSKEDILQIGIITRDLYDKIEPYISLE